MRGPTFGSINNSQFEDTDARLKAERTAAADRPSYTPSLDMKGSGLGMGGQSRAEQADQFADRNRHTMPTATRREQANNERLQADGHKAGKTLEAESGKINIKQAIEIRGLFEVARTISAERTERHLAERGSMRNHDTARHAMTTEAGTFSKVEAKPDMKALANEFKAAGEAPKSGQTLVQALRERGEGASIPDPQGNRYSLEGEKLVKRSPDNTVLKTMNAEDVHQYELKGKAKAAGMEQ